MTNRDRAARPRTHADERTMLLRAGAFSSTWPRVSRRRAPTALRSPISRVRSPTETGRVFMIPMPPTS